MALKIGTMTVAPGEAPADGGTYARKDGNWIDIEEAANLQVRRGTAAEVAGIIPLEGEPVWATDTKRLVIGDGVRSGGVPVGGFPLEGVNAGVPSQQNPFPVGNIFAAVDLEVRGSGVGATLVAGNSRGRGAVDLQMRRTAGTQVAGGDYSAVLGGLNSTASGAGSLAFGGTALASGGRSVAINGTADRANMRAFGYSESYRAQDVAFLLTRTTTNATPVPLQVVNNAGAQTALVSGVTIPSGVALACTVEVFGVKTSDGASAAHYIRKCVIRNVGGTTQLMGSPTAIGTDYESDAGLDVDITADDSADLLRIEVTGLASTTIRWMAVVRGVELAI
jgi:hypothetical protein